MYVIYKLATSQLLTYILYIENSVSNLPPASSDHERSKEDHDSKDYLRRSVENLFNLRYGMLFMT